MGRRVRTSVGLGLVALAVMATPATAWTATSQARRTNSSRHGGPGSPWVNKQGWGSQAMGKLAYGAKNTLLGWTKLVSEPYAAHRDGRSVGTGIGRGVLDAAGDTVGGAANVVTFPLTNVDVRLPDGGM